MKFLLCFLIFLLSGLGQSSFAGAFSKNDVKVFMDMTMVSFSGKSKKYFGRWERIIDIKYEGAPRPEDIQEVERTVDGVNSASGMEVMSTKQIAPNLTLYFMSSKEFGKLLCKSNYSNSSEWNISRGPQNDFVSAWVFVSDKLIGAERRSAIRIGLSRILGFTGQSPYLKHSSLKGHVGSYFPEYTDLEKKLMNMMFQDTIRSGMTKDQLKAALSAIEIASSRVTDDAVRINYKKNDMQREDSIYYIYYEDKQEGPYNKTQLKLMKSAGRITDETLGWYEGLPDWVTVGSLLQGVE